MYKNKNILVAGGTGAIGYHLVKKLLDLGAYIRVVSYDTPEYAKQLFGDSVEFLKLDLTNFENCMSAMKNMEYAFNMVCIKGSVGGHKELTKEFISYIRFQTNIMEAAYQSGISRFLYVSSINSYPQMSTPKKENEMWNGMPMQNDKYHGMLKRITEVQAMAYVEEGSWDGIRIVRPSNVYGPYDDFNPISAQVIPALIARVVNGENPVKVMGDGSAIRDFIYMDDVVNGMLEVFEKGLPSDPINLGSGVGVSIKRVTEILSKIYNNVQFEFDATKYSGDPVRILSMEKCKSTIGFECKTSIEQGLQKTLDWYSNNKILTTMKGRYDGKR